MLWQLVFAIFLCAMGDARAPFSKRGAPKLDWLLAHPKREREREGMESCFFMHFLDHLQGKNEESF